MQKGDQIAEVHKDEVDNYKTGDWVVMEEKPQEVKRIGRTKSDKGKPDDNTGNVG